MKILRFLIAILASLVLSLGFGLIISSVFNIGFEVPAFCSFVASFLPVPSGVFCINVFSAPGGAATAFNWQMNYLPQYISFTNAVALTSFRCETSEDGILHDWTAAGLVAMSAYRFVGVITANMIFLRIADGEIQGRNVTFSGVTSGAGVVPFFVSSERKGVLPYMSVNGIALAGVPTIFNNFTAIFAPTMATATDRAVVTYKDGLIQNLAMEDLRNKIAMVNQVATIGTIDNVDARIKQIELTCAAQTPVYILRAYIQGQ